MRTLSALLVLLTTVPALADEVCVSCTDPAAVYRCTLEKEKKIRKIYSGNDLYEKVCVAMLPKLGPHKTCAVTPNLNPCPGVEKTITLGDAISVVMGK